MSHFVSIFHFFLVFLRKNPFDIISFSLTLCLELPWGDNCDYNYHANEGNNYDDYDDYNDYDIYNDCNDYTDDDDYNNYDSYS